MRMFAVASTLVAAILVAGNLSAADKDAKAVKNQMVKGTIKLVDPAKALLVVSQKVKNENVDRELSITEKVEFVVKDGKEELFGTGVEALRTLQGKEGSSVQVKCDKDVNVLKVTVTIKKK
jgi:hypothetical protein